MAMDIRWILAYVVTSHVFLPLTQSRECHLILTSRRCERSCCGMGYLIKCLTSCEGIRCRDDYHCDGGCCGVNGRCRDCPATPMRPSPLRPTSSEIWECQYDSDCCFECSCFEGKCDKVPTPRTKVLWKTTSKQDETPSSATHHVTVLKAIFIFLGCTTCLVAFLVVLGISHCQRRRSSQLRAACEAERRIPPNLPRTVSQMNSAPNYDPTWTEIAVPNHNYTTEMTVRPSIISPPPYTLNPDVIMPPPPYEAAVTNNGYMGNI